ncbi:spore-associated protein A [Streptomyces sp. NPDC001422]|uniref:spore-associated protein A n=1 Tax=Streptomyces sp. NPDC001422 TaxID=3364575 RepID=UPI0036872B28
MIKKIHEGDIMKFKRIINSIAVISTAAAGLLVAAPNASAAASYNGACGSGYSVVNSARIGSYGTIFLTYSSSTGYNCAVTIRDTPDSTSPEVITVYLARSGGAGWKGDAGNYSSYAGPVYVSGVDACMDWTGGIVVNGVSHSASKNGTNCG